MVLVGLVGLTIWNPWQRSGGGSRVQLKLRYRRIRHDALVMCARLAALLLWLACSREPGVDSKRDVGSTEIRSDSLCSGCRIALRHIVTLGRATDDAAIVRYSTLARDSRGRYFVAPIGASGKVAVYSATGNLIGLVGRSDTGPGHLGSVKYVGVTRGDSLVVMDQSKLTLFAPSGRFARAGLLPADVRSFRLLTLEDGRVVLNNYGPRRPALGLLSPTLEEVRFFGRIIRGNDLDSLQYRLAAAGPGEILAAQESYGYALEIWDTTGTLKHRFVRRPEWSQSSSGDYRSRPSSSEGPPLARIVGVYADRRGKVWVSANVADANWEQGGLKVRQVDEQQSLVPLDDFPRLYDAVLDVLDIPSGRLLVTQRFDRLVYPRMLSNGWIYTFDAEPNGLIRFNVWKPELLRR